MKRRFRDVLTDRVSGPPLCSRLRMPSTTSTGPSRATPPSCGPPITPLELSKGHRGRNEPADHVLGRSRGGLTTKIHVAADGHPQLLALAVTAVQAGDAPAFEAVMASIRLPRTGPRPAPRPLHYGPGRPQLHISRIPRLRRPQIRPVIPQPSYQVRHRLRRGGQGVRPPGFDADA